MQRWIVASAAMALLAACERRAEDVETHAAPPSAASSQLLCKEHGVLEAVCTQCNPALAAVFQAKGDWCAEHGLPESFCPICHPERGGRPQVDVRLDEAPADGTKIRLATKDTARLAGIDSARAIEQPSGASVVAVARITYDAAHVAQVNARAPGVIRRIHADIGTRVQRGAPLVDIESAAVGADQSRLAAARARTAVAEAAHRRTRDLFDKGIAPANELLIAEQELEAARADQAAMHEALRIVGQTSGGATYTLVAPLAGIVTQRRSTVGTQVDVEDMLFEIVDPSVMWAEIDIPEVDLTLVQVSQRVVLEIDGLPDREFAGSIDYIAPAIDPKTRTALARVRLPNADGALRANMFGRARILAGDSRQSVLVPRSALQRAKGVPLVFVRLADDVYETRRVRLGVADGDMVVLREGVRPGEFVVTAGSFLLKTETLKGSIGAGCCDAVAEK